MTPGWIRARALAQFFAAPTNGARIMPVTAEEYTADPCRVPSLNASTAHALVRRGSSPLHAWTHHPRLGARANGSTRPMHDGQVIHRLLLGAGRDFELIEAPDYRTGLARERRDAAIAAGKIPILAHDYAAKYAAARALRKRCSELGFEFDGQSEVAIEWEECAYGDPPVLCRSMLDHIRSGARLIDLKKAETADPRQIERTLIDYGLDIQWAAYTRAYGMLEPDSIGRVDFTFLFVEIEPPYCVTPARLDGHLREHGLARWERAVLKWRECLASGEWPDYSEGQVVTLSAPAWALAAELGSTDL